MPQAHLNKHFYRKVLVCDAEVAMKMKHKLRFLSRDVINAPPAPDSAPHPCRLQTLPLAVAGGDVVKHGVQACVEDDQRHGDPPGAVDDAGRRAALDDLHVSEEVQQVHHVVGQEAEQHYRQDGVNDPHGFLRRSSLDPGNAPGGQRVAHQDDQGGQQGAKGQAQEAVRPQTRVPLRLGEILEAPVLAVFVLVGFQRSHEDEDQDGHSNGAPERRAHDQRAPGAAQPQVDVRVHGGDVAIHANAGHETDAQVDVGVEQDPGDAAGHVPEHPVVPVEVVVDPNGQSAEDEDVRESQAADVHAEGRARIGPEGEGDEGGHISWQSYD